MEPTNFVVLIGLMGFIIVGMSQYLSKTLRNTNSEIIRLQRQVVALRLKLGELKLECADTTEERDAIRAFAKKLYVENNNLKKQLAECLNPENPPASSAGEDEQK